MPTAAAGLWTLEHCCDAHPSALAHTKWARTHLWIQCCYHCSNLHTDVLVLSGWVCEWRAVNAA